MPESDNDGDPNQPPYLDAATLSGLLADDDRLRVVAALVLGADDVASVRNSTGLELPAIMRALQRLDDAGLVEREGEKHLTLLSRAFQVAARYEAQRRAAAPDAHPGVPDDEARVLRSFLRDGRLTHIPAQHSKRVVVLEHLAQQFEPGRRYSEKMVNLVLGRFHADTAALRRYLVDYGFLDRDHGEYWRSGGHVDLDS
ncbi:MAG TPA: DUF2087 domain-containing protein [Acidimicrobiia bacterium]|jgi:hypothetical protein